MRPDGVGEARAEGGAPASSILHRAQRFWGAATVVGGAIELIGAAALLLTPEPATVTKIAGGAVALHGVDTAASGIMQITSCRTRTS